MLFASQVSGTAQKFRFHCILPQLELDLSELFREIWPTFHQGLFTCKLEIAAAPQTFFGVRILTRDRAPSHRKRMPKSLFPGYCCPFFWPTNEYPVCQYTKLGPKEGTSLSCPIWVLFSVNKLLVHAFRRNSDRPLPGKLNPSLRAYGVLATRTPAA